MTSNVVAVIGPGGLALIGLGILTIPIWGPFAAVGYGGYLAVVKTKEVHEKTVPKVQKMHRNVYDFLNPDSLQVKIRDYTMRLKLDPKNAFILVLRGELYILQGNIEKAEADFIAALEATDSLDPCAHFYLGVVHQAVGNHRQALEDYSRAIKNNENRTALTDSAKNMDQFINKMEGIRRVVKRTGDGLRVGLTNIFGVNDYLNLNQKYIQEAHTIDRLDKALDKNLELSEMYYNRALVYMYLYEYENGLTDLETAIEIAGTDTSQRDHLPQYTFSQSIALYYMGKLDESLAKVNQAIELAKSQEFKDSFEGIIPTYLVQRACVYDRMYRYEEATKDRKHAKEKIPTINTTPFHIRLLDNDVVANIMSYMDGQTIVNTAMASRQLNAVFKTLEVNPLVYKDENTYMYMELGQYHEFLLLTAPQLKRILCYRYTNGHARVFKELYSTNKYVKEIKYWKDHNPVHREKECAELIKYFGEYMKDSYRVNRFCLPSNLKSRLEKEGKKLGKLLFKLGVHSIASMIEMIKDKGPLLVVVFYQGVYYAGYISQSSSIEAEQFVTDREAWLWRADKDTVHRVLIPEHAVVFAPYRNGLYFGGESEHEDYPNAALSCMMSTASFNANGVFEGWDVSDAELDPELNAYDCYASIYSVHSSH